MQSSIDNQIIFFENQDIKLEVNMKDETVWLTQQQMASLFSKNRTVITKHIANIFLEKELVEEECTRLVRVMGSDRPVKYYNLDVIISVGYRVKSQKGVLFRKWANKILKEYLLKGYVANQKRLDFLEKKINLVDIASRIDNDIKSEDAKAIIEVINNYSSALDLLDEYDHKAIKKPDGTENDIQISYEDCLKLIEDLKKEYNTKLFGIERKNELKGTIYNIYQSFGGQDVYQTVEEKAANFLYFIVKDHIFLDGNKRIGATLFIYFLNENHILYKNGKKVIEGNMLVALTLLIAQSNPNEKSLLIDLIMNFLK